MNNKAAIRLSSAAKRRWLTIIGLFFVMAAGLFVRLDDIRSWQSRPGQAFFRGEPLLTTFDGYFYLNLSRDLLTDNYDAVDDKQVVPAGRLRPFPPPLLAVLGASAAKITGISLNWVGTLLPPLLGVLLALPLFFLGRHFGGAVMGGIAAVSGLFFPYYIYRSNAGWFDTDCLNVTFATASTYLLLKFGQTSGKRRYCYFGAASLVYLLFLWWWDQAPAVVSLIWGANLAVALIFFYRPAKKEATIFYGILGAIVVLLMFWRGGSLPGHLYDSISGFFDYIYTSKNGPGIFPSASLTVSEQVRPGFNEIITKSTGSLPVFIAACVGLVMLFFRRTKEILFLIVPLGMASLSFLFAKRFLIFLNPITALGLGSFVAFIWYWRKRHWLLGLLAPLAFIVFIWPTLAGDLNVTHWPKEPGAIVSGMAAAKEQTPENAVVWAWWDHGYNMRYWSDRGVISDGSNHSGNISLYNALPLTVHNERLAANFMQFYVERGSEGLEIIYKLWGGDHGRAMQFIKEVLAAGPDDAKVVIENAGVAYPSLKEQMPTDELLDFFFPAQTRPVYLFLDWRLTITSYWWYWFGSWDFEKRDGKHPVFDLITSVSIKNGQVQGRNRQGIVQADMRTGILKIGNRQVPLAALAIYDQSGKVKTASYGRRGITMEVSLKNRVAALVDKTMSGSVFNRLYIRQQYDEKYFRPAAQSFPAWQLWEVTGDKAELSSLPAQTKLMPLRYKAELSSLPAQTKLMPLRYQR